MRSGHPEDDVVALRSSLADAEEQISVLMRERDDLQGKLTTTETTLQQAAEFGSQLVAQVNQQRSEIEVLQNDLKARSDQNEVHLQHVKSLTLKNNELEAELAMFLEEAEDHEQDRKKYASHVVQQSQRDKQHQEVLLQLEDRLLIAQDDLERVTKQLRQTKNENEELSVNCKKQSTTIEELQMQVEILEKDSLNSNNSAQLELDQVTEKYKELELKFSEAQHSSQQTRNMLMARFASQQSKHQEEVNKLEEIVSDLREEIYHLRDEARVTLGNNGDEDVGSSLHVELGKQTLMEELRSELASVRTKLKGSETAREKLEATHHDEINSLSRRLQTAKDMTATAKNNESTLRVELAGVRTQLEHTESQLSDIREELKLANSSKETADESVARLLAENRELQQSLQVTKHECLLLKDSLSTEKEEARVRIAKLQEDFSAETQRYLEAKTTTDAQIKEGQKIRDFHLAEIEELRLAQQTMQDINKALEDETRILKDQLGSKNAEMEGLEKKKVHMQQRFEELQESMKAIKATAEQRKIDLSALKTERIHLQETVNQLKLTIQLHQAAEEELNTKLKDKALEVDETSRQLKLLQAEIEEIKIQHDKTITKLTNDQDKLRLHSENERRTLENQLNLLTEQEKDQVNRLTLQVKEQATVNFQLGVELEALQKKLASAQEELITMSKSRDETLKELEKSKEENASVLKRMEDSISQYQLQYEILTASKIEAEIAANSVKNELSSALNRIDELQLSLEDVYAARENERNDAEDKRIEHINTLDSANSEIQALKNRVSITEALLATSQQEVESTQCERDMIQHQLSNANETIERLSSQLEESKCTLATKTAVWNKQRGQLEADLRKQSERAQEVENKLATANARIERDGAALSALQKDLEGMSEGRDIEISEATQRTHQLQSDLNDAHERHAKREEELLLQIRELSSNKDRLTTEHHRAVETKQKEIDDLQSCLNQTKQLATQSQAEVDRLAQELYQQRIATKELVSHHEASIKEKDSYIEQIKADLQQTTQDNSFANTRIGGLQKKLDQLSTERDDLASSVESTNAQLEAAEVALSKEKSAYQASVAVFKEDIEVAKRQITNLKDKVEKLNADVASARNDAITGADIIKDLEAELQATLEDAQETENELSDITVQLNQQMEIGRAAVTRAEQAEALSETLRGNCEVLKKELDVLKSQLTNAEQCLTEEKQSAQYSIEKERRVHAEKISLLEKELHVAVSAKRAAEMRIEQINVQNNAEIERIKTKFEEVLQDKTEELEDAQEVVNDMMLDATLVKGELDQIRKAKAELDSAYQNTCEKLAVLHFERDDIERRLKQSEDHAIESEERYSKLATDLEKTREVAVDLANKAKLSDSQVTRLTEELKSAKSTESNYKQRVTVLMANVDELKTQVAEEKSTNVKLRERAMKLQRASEEYREAANSVPSLSAQVKTLDASLAEVHQQKTLVEHRLEEVIALKNQFESRCKTLRTEHSEELEKLTAEYESRVANNDDEIQKLRDEVSSMMDMVSDLTTEQEELKAHLREQEHDHAMELDIKQCDMRRMQLDMEEINDELSRAREKLQYFKTHNDELSSERKKQQLAVDQLQDELQQARENEIRMGRDIDDLLCTITSLKEEMREAEEAQELAGGASSITGLVNFDASTLQYEELAEELQKIRAEARTAIARNERLSNENTRLQERLDETKEALRQSEQEASDLRNEISGLLQVNSELKTDLADLKWQLGSDTSADGLFGQTTLTTLQQHMKMDEVTEVREELRKSKSNVEELTYALDELRKKYDHAQVSHEHECRKLRDAKGEVNAEADNLMAMVTELVQEKRHLENRIKDFEFDGRLEKEIDQADGRLRDHIKAENADLRNQLFVQKQSNENLQEDLDASKAALRRLEEDFDTTVSQLKEEINQLLVANRELREQCNEYTATADTTANTPGLFSDSVLYSLETALEQDTKEAMRTMEVRAIKAEHALAEEIRARKRLEKELNAVQQQNRPRGQQIPDATSLETGPDATNEDDIHLSQSSQTEGLHHVNKEATLSVQQGSADESLQFPIQQKDNGTKLILPSSKKQLYTKSNGYDHDDTSITRSTVTNNTSCIESVSLINRTPALGDDCVTVVLGTATSTPVIPRNASRRFKHESSLRNNVVDLGMVNEEDPIEIPEGEKTNRCDTDQTLQTNDVETEVFENSSPINTEHMVNHAQSDDTSNIEDRGTASQMAKGNSIDSKIVEFFAQLQHPK